MQHEILNLIDRYWKFDKQQQPVSSWHDKQDLLKAVQEELGLPDVIKSVCRCGTVIEEEHYWLCEKCREELKTK